MVVRDKKKRDLETAKDYSIFALPMLCDLIGSTAQYYALIFVDSSVY